LKSKLKSVAHSCCGELAVKHATTVASTILCDSHALLSRYGEVGVQSVANISQMSESHKQGEVEALNLKQQAQAKLVAGGVCVNDVSRVRTTFAVASFGSW
jgi:hypothetical protein